jgi:hypothetical protein
MSPSDWAAVTAAVLALLTGFFAGIRWLVKSYLHELVPNSGSSLKDKINRLESRIDEIYMLLVEKDR